MKQREIKFRAWDKKKKTWIFDFRIHPDGTVMAAEKSRGGLWKYEHSTRSMKHIVLVQYTGLKDKNGKEIYEGDIVNVGETNIEVSFRDGMFMAEGEKYSSELWLYKSEVVGNVYENKNLIKKVNNK